MIKDIDDVQWYDGIVGQIPEWDKFLRQNPLLPYLPFVKPKPLLIVIRALTELQERKQGGNFISDRKDLLGQLLQAAYGESGEVWRRRWVRYRLWRYVSPLLTDRDSIRYRVIDGRSSGAGADSTASIMQSFCNLVLSSPPVYKKLVSEILQAEKSGHLSEMIAYTEAQNLPYFQASHAVFLESGLIC
jgi:hypothetical protein